MLSLRLLEELLNEYIDRDGRSALDVTVADVLDDCQEEEAEAEVTR